MGCLSRIALTLGVIMTLLLAGVAHAQAPGPFIGRQPGVVELSEEFLEENAERRRNAALPAPPALLSPAGVARGRLNGQDMALAWRSSEPVMRRSATAVHFVVCIAPAPQGACAWPGHHTIPVASMTGEPDVFLGRVQPGSKVYRFALPAATARAALDQDMSIILGGCTGTSDDTCRYAAPKNVYWSTRNLMAPRARSGIAMPPGDTARAHVVVRASNGGESATGQFVVGADFHDARLDPRTQACLLDVNAPTVQPSDLVFFSNGTQTPVSSLPTDRSGRRIANAVAGIAPAGDAPLRFLKQRSVSPGLVAGASDQPAAEFTLTFSWTRYPASPKRFIAVMTLDADDQIREYDEKDNVAAGCTREAFYRT